MAYLYGNRNQITFLPDSIEKYVSEDDPVRVYDAFIDALPKQELGLVLNENAVGNASYDPITMLKILVYGYSYGWRSSRKLERALYHNMSFVWLAGGLKPDHKTISNFRGEHKDVLINLLKQCARMCVKLDLISGNTLFVDGSKFRGNAGTSQTKSKPTWEKYHKQVEHRIGELLKECQKIDEREACEESLVKMHKELKSKERLKAKIGQLLEEIKGDKINGTDPDCPIMKGRQGSHTSYNCQMVSDDANGLVLSTDASTSKNDLNELTKQVVKAEDNLGKPTKTVCADAGYSSVEDIKPLVADGKTVIVPNSKQSQKEKGQQQDQFSREAFSYNSNQDIYTCPMGKELTRRNPEGVSNHIPYRMINPSACKICTHFGECTTSLAGRRIYRIVDEALKEKLERLYESDEGQQVYRRRKMRVEHIFGHIKRNLGAGAFLLRGLKGANVELSILATCFNVVRIITIMGGVKPALLKLKPVGG